MNWNHIKTFLFVMDKVTDFLMRWYCLFFTTIMVLALVFDQIEITIK